MNTETYTPDGRHPEDAIYSAKTFINELQKVQNDYFNKLVCDLNITKEGEDWLFDYIYNNTDDDYDGFDHFLETFRKKYDDMVKPKINVSSTNKDYIYNSSETLLSSDLGEFSPMMHMSSYEPDLDTAFPSAYNDNEPFSLGLDTISFKLSS